MSRWRVVIAERHSLVRWGLRACLTQAGIFDLVAEVGQTEALPGVVKDTQPDLLLLDVQLLAAEGPASLANLLAPGWRPNAPPSLRVLLTGDEGHEAAVREALRRGARGYIRKCDREVELPRAALAICSGDMYLDADYARQVALAEHRLATAPPVRNSRLARLTERELAVFKLIGEGYTTRAAAQHIQLSPKTVEKHRAAVMQKLQLRDAVHLRLAARELGILG